MLKKLSFYLGALFAVAMLSAAAQAGTLVFEAEEEEEIIIIEETPTPPPGSIHSYGFDIDLTQHDFIRATAASISLDLRDNDSDSETALIVIEDFTGVWGATTGSPAPGFTADISSAQILAAINQGQSLHVEIQATAGGFSYSGSTLTVTATEVPEPAGVGLIVLGCLAARVRRGRRL